MKFDLDSNRDMWTSGRDTAQAVGDCKAFLRTVDDGVVNPVDMLDETTHAINVVLDGPGGDGRLAMAALRSFQTACRQAEISRRCTTDERLGLRLTPAIWSAIVHHRLGYPREALSRAYTAWMELERFVGHERVVYEALSSVTPSAVGEHAVAITTILSATLRRVDLPPETQELLVNRCRRLYGAYALHGREPVIYPRTPAFAAQVMYLLAEQRNPDDKPLVEALKALDARTRPTHVRGQATLRLCEHAYELYCGNTQAASVIAKTALEPISAFPLPRHESRIVEQGYLG